MLFSHLFLSGGCQSVPRGQVLHVPQENQPGWRHAGLGARALWDPTAASLHLVPSTLPPLGAAIQHHGRAVSVHLLSPWSGRAPCWVGSLLQVSEWTKKKPQRNCCSFKVILLEIRTLAPFHILWFSSFLPLTRHQPGRQSSLCGIITHSPSPWFASLSIISSLLCGPGWYLASSPTFFSSSSLPREFGFSPDVWQIQSPLSAHMFLCLTGLT